MLRYNKYKSNIIIAYPYVEQRREKTQNHQRTIIKRKIGDHPKFSFLRLP